MQKAQSIKQYYYCLIDCALENRIDEILSETKQNGGFVVISITNIVSKSPYKKGVSNVTNY